jgi:hypothetical protein
VYTTWCTTWHTLALPPKYSLCMQIARNKIPDFEAGVFWFARILPARGYLGGGPKFARGYLEGGSSEVGGILGVAQSSLEGKLALFCNRVEFSSLFKRYRAIVQITYGHPRNRLGWTLSYCAPLR